MAVYDKNGQVLSNVYDANGNVLSQAYDAAGNVIHTTEPIVPDLKVMTYNPQWFTGINSQQAMQNAIIKGNNADIIGFQEFSRNSTIQPVGQYALSDYETILLSNHYNYNAIASKTLELTDITIADFETQDQESETRCYMKCYFTIGAKKICWINTHLCYKNNSAQFAQMAEIFALAEQEEYCIVTGDFNSTAQSVSDSDYIGLYKQFVDAGYNLANSTAKKGFTKTWTDSTTATSLADMTDATDNIITSGNIDILSVKFDITKFNYLDGNAIDHIPIIAELKIN